MHKKSNKYAQEQTSRKPKNGSGRQAHSKSDRYNPTNSKDSSANTPRITKEPNGKHSS